MREVERERGTEEMSERGEGGREGGSNEKEREDQRWREKEGKDNQVCSCMIVHVCNGVHERCA